MSETDESIHFRINFSMIFEWPITEHKIPSHSFRNKIDWRNWKGKLGIELKKKSRNIINGEITCKTSLGRALLNWKIYLKKLLRQQPKDKWTYKLEAKRYVRKWRVQTYFWSDSKENSVWGLKIKYN